MTRNKHSGKILEGRYEILSLLDEGGMGAVYLGRHIKLGRNVAVKFLHGELAGHKDSVTRFYREAQAASGISHPNIIDVYDVGVADWGEPYLVMEYMSGENLGSLLKRKGPISLAASCGIMEPTLRALYAAHERGIVHRDLKPENIFLMRQEEGPPVIKVIDFGISKFLQTEQTQLTRTGSLLGTPSYMSPEQARGRGTFDHRADIYSIGVVLHTMLCGSLPFVGESYNDLIVTILTEPAKKPTDTYPNFPADAEPIIMRLLEKDPERRFRTCIELLDALSSLEAFSNRQEALSALTADMPQERFATGDLGEANKLFDEMATTMYADMGKNGVETVPEKPSEDAVMKITAPPPAMAKPSSQPRPEKRSRRWSALFFLVAFVAVGLGIGLYATSQIPASWSNSRATADAKSVSPRVLPATTPEVKEKPPVVAPHTNDEKIDGEVSNPEPAISGDEMDGTDDTVTAITNDTPTEVGPSEQMAVSQLGATSATAPQNNPANKPKDTPEKKNAGVPEKPVAPSQKAAAVSPAPMVVLSPLTPVAVNSLLNARRGRIMSCYDIARANNPELAGILELKVGMADTAVEVAVTGGNVSKILSACVIRVIKSISVPPNDGTLVEILKEYEFR